MSDIEAPSFSLGLEFDLDVLESPPPPLKRLRRGPPKSNTPSSLSDDIEDFSDQDYSKDISRNQCHSLASSSKLPLQLRKTGHVPHSITSQNIGSNTNKILPTHKSMSPVRRFQLVDSDSDDSFLDDMVTQEANHFVLPANKEIPNKETQQDLWKGFFPEKDFDIPTPAFDQVCKEFFSSVNHNNPIQNNNSGGCSQTSNFRNKRVQQFTQDPQSPAHSYFFHDDPRIQKLVRERLPNFSPLGAGIRQEYQDQDVSAFDYISQFGNGTSSSVASKYPGEVNSSKGRKNTGKRTGSVVTQERENWVNPKISAGISKETGQRKIQAGENAAGHWFTNAEGRKVYITKNGQEMTGQQAYRNYRKESGAGYKKSKKKSNNKKKAAAKRNEGLT